MDEETKVGLIKLKYYRLSGSVDRKRLLHVRSYWKSPRSGVYGGVDY